MKGWNLLVVFQFCCVVLISDRMACHRGESPTCSTVSSPVMTGSSLGRIPSPTASIFSPTQVRSSLLKAHNSPAIKGTSPSKQSVQSRHKLPQNFQLISPPPTVCPSLPKTPPPPSDLNHAKHFPSPFGEVLSDSDDEVSPPTFELGRPLKQFATRGPRIHSDQGKTGKAVRPAVPPNPLNALHPVIAAIQPEYSTFSPSGTSLIPPLSMTASSVFSQSCKLSSA